jgi:hypothetical protein
MPLSSAAQCGLLGGPNTRSTPVSRVHEALKRFRSLRLREAEGQQGLLKISISERRHPEPFPAPDTFVSPWQFSPADEVPAASPGTPELEPALAESVTAAVAVLDDRDSGPRRGALAGGFGMDRWSQGPEPAGHPPTIDSPAVVAPAGDVCVSPTADPDTAGANLVGTCRVTDAALQPAASQEQEVQTRLARRIATGQRAPLALTQAVFEDLLAEVGAARGRLLVKTPDVAQPVTLAVVGSWLTTIPFPELEPIRTEFGPDVIVTTVSLAGGSAAAAEFRAAEGIPFSRGQSLVAEAGMKVLGTWLSGVTSASAGGLAERAADLRPAPEPDAAGGREMERVKRLSLKGGVLVARFSNGGPPGAWAVTSVIEAIRGELRSSDLLGQLPTGEITALLVRASADGVVSVAWRVRERLEELARERGLPPIELGHAIYPDGGAESLGALVERALPSVTCGSEVLGL